MNVVDASGWLEYFSDGPDAAFVAQVLQETDSLIVPTVTILEVFGSVCRSHGEGAALQAAAAMQQGTVVNLDTAGALDAGRLSVMYGVSTSAGAVLAAAERHGATVWTLDESVRQVPGVRFREPTGRRIPDPEPPKNW
ncbi:MAG: type II toxin-antitoxin system VapC family toxin [Gemmatimonadota bacterium]|nr:type II toxin-antitoxin system VapC family toxin [Gemmatimonadota bacterium]